MGNALLAQNALHTFDGVTFIIKQVANALQERDVRGPVVASATRALHRLDLAKAGFPETKHMLWQVQNVRRFAYCAKRFRAFGRGTRHVVSTPLA
jgi:hypothetical protein